MCTPVKDIEEEKYKVFLSIVANAIVNPRAVMIHPSYASLAYTAMMRVWWFYRVTFLALLGHNFI